MAAQIFLQEQLLGIVVFRADPEVPDAIHEGHFLLRVDGLSRHSDELLRILGEVAEPVAPPRDFRETFARQLILSWSSVKMSGRMMSPLDEDLG